MVDVVFVSMCDGVVGVICNIEEGGCLLKKVGGANKWPMWWGGLIKVRGGLYNRGVWYGGVIYVYKM